MFVRDQHLTFKPRLLGFLDRRFDFVFGLPAIRTQLVDYFRHVASLNFLDFPLSQPFELVIKLIGVFLQSHFGASSEN